MDHNAAYAHSVFSARARRHAGRALLARDEVFALDEAGQALASARIAVAAANDAGEQPALRPVYRLALSIQRTIERRRFGRAGA
jgi:hypothetical protein